MNSVIINRFLMLYHVENPLHTEIWLIFRLSLFLILLIFNPSRKQISTQHYEKIVLYVKYSLFSSSKLWLIVFAA